jgi:hypothetical protein
MATQLSENRIGAIRSSVIVLVKRNTVAHILRIRRIEFLLYASILDAPHKAARAAGTVVRFVEVTVAIPSLSRARLTLLKSVALVAPDTTPATTVLAVATPAAATVAVAATPNAPKIAWNLGWSSGLIAPPAVLKVMNVEGKMEIVAPRPSLNT